jgi:ABC-2 type transport system permease protein
MNKFLTLIRRDLADNRGALIITPVVIAAILLAVTLVASLTGNARFGFDPGDFSNTSESRVNSVKAELEIDGGSATVIRDRDGRITIVGPTGEKRTLDKAIDKKTKEGITAVLPVGTAIASSLPLGIALIAILFLQAGALHDERKDRTILFWKSMPVSDLETVGAKLVSIVGIGLFFALMVGIVLHLAITTIAVLTLNQVGITGVTLLPVLANAAKVWIILTVGLLFYIGWAMPVYGWFSMVSAWAPKMPFIAAFAPLVVVPLVYMAIAYRGNDEDKILDFLWDPAGRLIGEPLYHDLGNLSIRSPEDVPAIPVNEILGHLTHSLTQPMFWVGLVVAAGFIYAASEIRRRRAL